MLTKKNAPTNTTETVKNNPSEFLAESMIFGSGAIERMEARGQREFVETQVLPTKMSAEDKNILEAAGFKFLGQVEGDDVFQRVEFPAGWKKEATDHSMWSKLVDDKGRERAMIFYKAAFYDRSAHLTASRRFSCRMDYDRSGDLVAVAQVKDGDAVMFSTNEIKTDTRSNWYAAGEKLEAVALSWLNEKFPDWKSPAAYWD